MKRGLSFVEVAGLSLQGVVTMKQPRLDCRPSAPPAPATTKGFSLVELSIVLVILGLLVGGIMTGQNLIRAAELRAVTTEFKQYQTAVNLFKEKYFALPGDMSNAEDFWDTMSSGTCPNATGGTGTQTCKGDGDGMIIDGTGGANQTDEMYTFWQHLANAGLIEGQYNGLAGPSNKWHHERGVNSPVSRVGNGGWSMYTDASPITGSTEQFDGAYGHALHFGNPSSGGAYEEPILIPEEAWNIDTKIDNGKPATGNVRVRRRVDCALAADGSALTTSAADAAKLDSVYNLADDAQRCALKFAHSF